MRKILRIDPADTLIVALADLAAGEEVEWAGERFRMATDVRAKHKFAARECAEGEPVWLYGTIVGRATRPIRSGEAVTTDNIRHAAADVPESDTPPYVWQAPDVSALSGRTFEGYLRPDGRVGTANHWLVLPLVFCANRNARKLAETLSDALGYGDDDLEAVARRLVGGDGGARIDRRLPNVDGIRAIDVTSGCGGAASDCEALCDVLAAYADHPNVAGITVFSLGCEKSQIAMFREALHRRNPAFAKPALFYRQQDWASEAAMMEDALRQTFAALTAVNDIKRQPVPLAALRIAVKCGGSDGFSGLSANPVIGLVSDAIIALGGASVLAEFPELCGAEGAIAARCVRPEDRARFLTLMRDYEATANRLGTTIADNPSWGNIEDGLTTDAIKSCGAARKAGRAPVVAVRDYGEAMADSGLTLLCTPGNDLIAVTGQVAAGATLVLFSTGLGTPTGNPIAPVVKIATNSVMAARLSDMIDFDCGPVIDGAAPEAVAADLIETMIAVASGRCSTKADRLEQHDFLFWKRSLDL
ncbi:MAG: garD 3 [Proteobacteria bacterium]|nr:garD 3 [Pseudomonadota bacterium]